MAMNKSISFLTPYWNGDDMMRIHLTSIRKFFPDAPILISKLNTGLDENEETAKLELLKQEFGIQYWIDNAYYVEAMKHLYEKVETDLVCILDHDVVLLDDIHYLVNGIGKEWDLVGIEEKIHHPWADTWMRFAPGNMDMTFMIFDLKDFVAKYGYEGIAFTGDRTGHKSQEYHYGLCERLPRHKYLLPYHTEKYGLGNLLKDGDKNVVWHQWYGSYQKRNVDNPRLDRVAMFGGKEYLQKAERAFLSDYPNLDFNNIRSAHYEGGTFF